LATIKESFMWILKGNAAFYEKIHSIKPKMTLHWVTVSSVYGYRRESIINEQEHKRQAKNYTKPPYFGKLETNESITQQKNMTYTTEQ